MNETGIKRARAAAEEFAAAAQDAIRELRAEHPESAPRYYITGTKISGRLRRASLDLTRLLAEMRRP